MIKNIGLTATQAMTPKGRPGKLMHAKDDGISGRRAAIVTGLKAGSMGHKSHRRNKMTITGLRAGGF